MQLPDGKLICSHNGNSYKWYQSLPKKLNYIPKTQKDLAEKLAYKKYISLKLEDLLTEKKAIEPALSYYSSYLPQAEAFLSSSSEQQALLLPSFHADNSELQEWADAPYDRYQGHPENLIFATSIGISVRSKSVYD